MKSDTGTRVADWIDSIHVKRNTDLKSRLQKAGFVRSNWFPGWWREVLLDGVIPGHDPEDPGFAFSSRHINFWNHFDLPEGLDRNGMRPGIMDRIRDWAGRDAGNDHVIGNLLSKAACARPRARSSNKTGRKWGWRFMPLRDCRQQYVDHYPGFALELEEGWKDQDWGTDTIALGRGMSTE
jgi:hypothetical protein